MDEFLDLANRDPYNIGGKLCAQRAPSDSERLQFAQLKGVSDWKAPYLWEHPHLRDSIADLLVIMYDVARADALACVDAEVNRLQDLILTDPRFAHIRG